MNRVIYKHELELIDVQQVILPLGAQILDVQEQDGKLQLWALQTTDPEQPPCQRIIVIVGTGIEFPAQDFIEHITTVQKDNFVWHIFERNP